TPCDINGNDLSPHTSPPPYMAPDGVSSDPDNWDPFKDHTSFEMANFLFRRNQMPATQIDELFDL
ncbi:hypothetical protein L208DRAFT_1332861, partial [Tricholoma matsutake]